MKIHEKIRLIRKAKGWSQEEVAQKLNISLNAYGHIERAETHPNSIRLEQIAQALETDLTELVSDRNVFNLGGTYSNHCQNWYSNSSPEPLTQIEHELEKARLINESQAKEIELLKQQNADLRQQNADLRKIIDLKLS